MVRIVSRVSAPFCMITVKCSIILKPISCNANLAFEAIINLQIKDSNHNMLYS